MTAEKLEGYIRRLRQMLNLGIHVDKDELVKALNYDRHQYLKGYRDGLAEAEKRIEKAREVLEGI